MITSETTAPAACLTPSVERLGDLALRHSNHALWFAEVEADLLVFQAALANRTRSIIEDDLYQVAVWQAPRVASQVRRLGAECHKLVELTALSLASLHAPGRSATTVRDTLDQLHRLASRHQSRALAIDHEAFCVDIGGQG